MSLLNLKYESRNKNLSHAEKTEIVRLISLCRWKTYYYEKKLRVLLDKETLESREKERFRDYLHQKIKNELRISLLKETLEREQLGSIKINP